MSEHASAQDLSLLIDGELARLRGRRLEEHIQDCDTCRDRYLSTLKLVEGLQGLERVAPPSTLGMVVEHNRLRLGNPSLRRRLERNWKRWPDPMILTYLAVTLALGVMVMMVTRVGESERNGTVILAPAHSPVATHDPTETWVEPGISTAEAAAARVADPAEADQVMERLMTQLPASAAVVIARLDGEVVKVEVTTGSGADQAEASSGE